MYRPVASLAWGVSILSGSMKCLYVEVWKNIMAIVLGHQQKLLWQLPFLHCTGTASCFCAQCNTGFSFDPARTCSYLPSSYSSHMILQACLQASQALFDVLLTESLSLVIEPLQSNKLHTPLTLLFAIFLLTLTSFLSSLPTYRVTVP